MILNEMNGTASVEDVLTLTLDALRDVKAQRATAAESTLATGFGQYAISGNLTYPAWATKFEGWFTGAAGGAAGCQGQNSTQAVSGAGGGSGATLYAVIAGKPGDVLSLTLGAGGAGGVGGVSGTSGQTGGGTTCALNGTALFVAGGGYGGAWLAGYSSAGGAGGFCTIFDYTPLQTFLLLNGASGSDGQAGEFIFPGNGASSFWGGAGRAGSGAGNAGATYGAGGGGAYDPNYTNKAMPGGAGGSSVVIGRFLP